VTFIEGERERTVTLQFTPSSFLADPLPGRSSTGDYSRSPRGVPEFPVMRSRLKFRPPTQRCEAI